MIQQELWWFLRSALEIEKSVIVCLMDSDSLAMQSKVLERLMNMNNSIVSAKYTHRNQVRKACASQHVMNSSDCPHCKLNLGVFMT